MENVDILKPPTFEKSGIIKTRAQANADGDWIGVFNLWIVQRSPMPAIVMQIRSQTSTWAPGKLDLSAGGHLSAGEEPLDGIREVREELGCDYSPESLYSLGRRLNVGSNIRGAFVHIVSHVFMVEDNRPLDAYTLDPGEVSGICTCGITDIIRAYEDPTYSFTATGLTAEKQTLSLTVTEDSFPYNWDRYMYKAALLADRFLKGERPLMI
ncbi:MAG: NUDIX domain-containing protein [Patescibacteria group bacterium]